MKKNEDFQREVLDAMKWEPLLKASVINVTARDGTVTLTGTVDGYAKKSEAEDAAKNVSGEKAVVENITIKFTVIGKKSNSEISHDVLNAFHFNWEIPHDIIKVSVEDGWVTLEGELDWHYQMNAAKKAVSTVAGITRITNHITIKSKTDDVIEIEKIESALKRNWSINDRDIEVKVSGTKVILNGTVHSLYQRDEAGRIAWKAPGVWTVDNKLAVACRD